ncbi:type II TA system antitoxin MqsA family protein [Pectobacterium brasiliense]|uniref:type II TA system antitoxin MqsA family protein n=1 Tax=Pectobacterium brasiliense TaxID=180957 RepID=UPI00196933D1|nr:type II TA system antitoxin MqsA family protein [Pectobacterium brasiliense]MBN3265779.1 type II toxin-antitoxin system MqsA family antitoxin [Pectobacterium brasiliense]
MKCPECGGAELVHDTKDVPYSWRGKKTMLRSVTGLYCPACGEAVLNKEEEAAYREKMVEFRNSIINDTIEPSYIADVRRKLGFTRKAAGEFFGGGENAFSRYELGKAQPPQSTIKLIKLLDRHPDLLSEIR